LPPIAQEPAFAHEMEVASDQPFSRSAARPGTSVAARHFPLLSAMTKPPFPNPGASGPIAAQLPALAHETDSTVYPSTPSTATSWSNPKPPVFRPTPNATLVPFGPSLKPR